jgi:hypothetical protein
MLMGHSRVTTCSFFGQRTATKRKKYLFKLAYHMNCCGRSLASTHRLQVPVVAFRKRQLTAKQQLMLQPPPDRASQKAISALRGLLSAWHVSVPAAASTACSVHSTSDDMSTGHLIAAVTSKQTSLLAPMPFNLFLQHRKICARACVQPVAAAEAAVVLAA